MNLSRLESYTNDPFSGRKHKRRRRLNTEGEEVIEEALVEMIAGDLERQIKENLKLPMPVGDRICSKDNHVYFYSDITDGTAFRFNMVLKDTIREMQELGLKYDISPPPIKIHINSMGGQVFGGLSMVDTIRSSPIEIHSIVEGGAASAATFISIVCKKRYIKKHAFMLIHQVSSGVWGKMSEIMDEAESLKRITDVLEDIYLNETNMTRATLRSLMKHDLWMKPDECKEKGFVDEIIE